MKIVKLFMTIKIVEYYNLVKVGKSRKKNDKLQGKKAPT